MNVSKTVDLYKRLLHTHYFEGRFPAFASPPYDAQLAIVDALTEQDLTALAKLLPPTQERLRQIGTETGTRLREVREVLEWLYELHRKWSNYRPIPPPIELEGGDAISIVS